MSESKPYPSPDTDGIDPDSCKNDVHISNSIIEVGDYCFAIKSDRPDVRQRMLW